MKSRKMISTLCLILSIVLLVSFIFADRYNSYAAISTSPRLNVKNLSMIKGKSYTIRLYNVKKDRKISFKSGNSDIVYIKRATTKFCIVRAKASGNTTITATVTDAEADTTVKLKCKVTVSPPAISVKFSSKKVKLTVGTTKKQKFTIKPNISCEKPVFSSENEKIATISSTGIITGVSPGKTVIHAVISNGKEATLKVTVTASKDKATAAPPTKTIAPAPTIPPVKTPAPSASPIPSAAPPTATPNADHDIPLPSKNKSKNR